MKMDEVSVVIERNGGGNNLSGSADWWAGVAEEDALLSLPLDSSEGGLWAGNFVPPPPRPLFLDESVTPDGLTTCDLCSWAWQNGNNVFTLDTTLEAPGEIGWVLTLIIVSLISALIGAIVMIVVLHCKSRLKTNRNETERNSNTSAAANNRPPISLPDDKTISVITTNVFDNNTNSVWSWLSRRSTMMPCQLENPAAAPAENHYTHMEENYNGVGEALYAELDRESTVETNSNSPAYQNSAYTDPDAPVSSAPSSAYYSDLSVTTVPERAYEIVGLSTMPTWEVTGVGNGSETKRQPLARLAAISETVSVPSDYV